MHGLENKSFESGEKVISTLPIDSSFLNRHYYDSVNVKHSSDFHIGPKIEVHINNDKKKKSSKIIKDILPELRRTDRKIKLRPAIAGVTILILVILLIIAASYFLSGKKEYGNGFQNVVDETSSVPSYQNQSMYYNVWNTLKIVPRREWLSEPARDPLTKLQHPVHQVVITHTASDICENRSGCKFLVRYIQNFHIEGNNWSDIGYNFLVGGDGYVYEGRGWDYVGAFAKGSNNVSIGIAMIGSFVKLKPTEKQLNATKLLIDEGVRLKKISNDYRLVAHCNVSDTTSPGLNVFEELKTWPHFSEIPV